MYFEFHAGRRQTWAPAVDVCERAEEVVILVEMPGIVPSEVKLSWHEGVLTISGHKRQPSNANISRHFCVERAYGEFCRELSINIPVDQDRARAELHDGLMRIYLPKKTFKPEAIEIPIHYPER